MSELSIGGVALASPTEISINDEIIWSSGTGRSASGLMTGDVIAEKRTVAIRWGILTEAERNVIKSHLRAGFFTVTILGRSITGYRGTITEALLGRLSDGITYYKELSVTIIEQ
ncbi:hypothetical protein F9856_06370 [Streptococcus suis]|uniref:hypothetical protein n=1 Tax=Streptococcus suis TaxID=1307 RepID=UPI001920E263|nr:hypothetical protein [Streptococcus suis]MBL1125766.1 hypothetical protein [Streptococcus suis]